MECKQKTRYSKSIKRYQVNSWTFIMPYKGSLNLCLLNDVWFLLIARLFRAFRLMNNCTINENMAEFKYGSDKNKLRVYVNSEGCYFNAILCRKFSLVVENFGTIFIQPLKLGMIYLLNRILFVYTSAL